MEWILIVYRDGQWWTRQCFYYDLDIVRPEYEYIFPVFFAKTNESSAADIVIDFNKANLKPETIEKLADAMVKSMKHH